jgi:hypothetical protein
MSDCTVSLIEGTTKLVTLFSGNKNDEFSIKGTKNSLYDLDNINIVLSVAGLTGVISASALINALVASLPTSDPHVAGHPWVNGSLIAVSQG